jgi:hypothetical protein
VLSDRSSVIDQQIGVYRYFETGNLTRTSADDKSFG